MGSIPGSRPPLEEEMATHSSIPETSSISSISRSLLFEFFSVFCVVFSVPPWEVPPNISYKTGLVVVNSFSFCLSLKCCLSFKTEWYPCLWEYSRLQAFPFHYFEYMVPLPSGLQSSAEKSAERLMGVPLYITSCFSLAAFKILIFHFWHFNYNVSWCWSLRFLVWDSLCCLDLDACFFPQVRELFST